MKKIALIVVIAGLSGVATIIFTWGQKQALVPETSVSEKKIDASMQIDVRQIHDAGGEAPGGLDARSSDVTERKSP